MTSFVVLFSPIGCLDVLVLFGMGGFPLISVSPGVLSPDERFSFSKTGFQSNNDRV